MSEGAESVGRAIQKLLASADDDRLESEMLLVRDTLAFLFPGMAVQFGLLHGEMVAIASVHELATIALAEMRKIEAEMKEENPDG